MSTWRPASRWSAWTIATAFGVALPWLVADAYLQNLLVQWGIFALLGLSMNIIFGLLGELSFGHAAFFGVGAYASVLLTSRWTAIPPWFGLIFAASAAGLAGLMIGYVTLRIKGPQFAIVTLAFASILYVTALSWTDLTRGPMGIPGVRPFDLGGVTFEGPLPYYYLVWSVVGLSLYLSWRLVRSRDGRAMQAIRENDALAAAVGINVLRYKLLGFVMSTVIAGAAGSLFAHYVSYISPDLLTPYYVVAMIIIVIMGGQGRLLGPIVGAALYLFIPELLRATGTLQLVAFALILIIFVMFLPDGLASAPGRVRSAMTALRHRRTGPKLASSR